MVKRGIHLELNDGYNNDLVKLLSSIYISRYKWKLTNDAVHVIINNEFTNNLLFNGIVGLIEGSKLDNLIKTKEYSVIFLTLYGLKLDADDCEIKNYKDYLNSSCEIMIDINDSVYTFILCKDENLLEELYKHAINKGYSNVKFITEENILMNERGFFC